MSISVRELLFQDAISEAVDAAVTGVKSAPNDIELRVTLAQLLALSGDLERAETHAKMAQVQSVGHTVALSEFRQYLRALHARAAWWSDGAAPEFPGAPTPSDAIAMALNVALKSRDDTEAAALAKQLEDTRATCPVTWDEVEVEDLRDVDDRLPHAVEALTPGGHYLWIDLARIARIDFEPVVAPFDVLARPARLRLRDGSTADLRLAAIYDAPRSGAEMLGRVTDFSQVVPDVTRGHGQRSYLLNDTLGGLLDPTTVVFNG
ncbi:type VI secretion system accessory protein TagJ [Tateyamaria sp. ANG-S1]|uniref:type VI secretion system accessory protein TagJ n=1 Tax=Tateyamaria sp. ANG-S1 TaxID=1577905 RepID=UPI00126A756B|nr:type VI secretion system accessory protein TagJ [Tateyamaria sp. ANG-S1]